LILFIIIFSSLSHDSDPNHIGSRTIPTSQSH
jgi:hypothetical protein